MLRRIVVVSVSLLGLIGLSPFMAVAEAERPAEPSIREMEEFAEVDPDVAAQKDASLDEAEAKIQEGKPAVAREILDRLSVDQMSQEQLARAGALAEKADTALREREEPLTDQELKALELEEELALRFRVEREARQTRAAELVEEGSYLLYHEADAERAYELAMRALQLHPESLQAQNLRVAAGLQLGKPQEERIFEMEKMARRPTIRQQSAIQALENHLAAARRAYQQDDYQTALERLRNARLITETLATYMDVTAEREEVERMLEVVQREHRRYERDLAERRRREAEERAEELADRVAEEKRLESARRIEEVIDLIEEAEFDQAESVLDDWAVDDPSEVQVQRLRRRLGEARSDFDMDRANLARDLGDMRWEVQEARREAVPERLFNYPDKAFWQQVVERRESVLYPSETIQEEMPDEDRVIHEEMDRVHEWRFVDTPLDEVVEFLEQITDVPYILRRQDLPADRAPVTFTMTTSLENALDHITEIANMDWRIRRGAIVIGAAGALREYEQRTYPILDLLISRGDAVGLNGADVGRGAAGLGGRGTEGTGRGTTGRGTRGQFGADAQDGGAAQFGGQIGTGAGVGTGVGAEEDAMMFRAQNLILLLKQVCGVGTWRTLEPGAIDVTQTGAPGVGAPAAPQAPFGAPAQPPGPMFPDDPFAEPWDPQQPDVPTHLMPQGEAFVLGQDPGQIIVYQSPEVHECIERLLKDMRAAMKIQVFVDFRFLQVSTDFFREVGFRWDNMTIDGSAFSGPLGSLRGLGVHSPGYGAFSPFLTGDVFESFFVPEEDWDGVDPTAGEWFGVPSQPYMWLRHPFEQAEVEIEDDGTIVHQVVGLPGSPPFIGTRTPFFDTASGMNLNLGYGGERFNIAGVFRLAHERDAARTLSAPQIMLTNGQQGFILSSTEFDYVDTYDVEDNILVPSVDTVTSSIGLLVRPVVSDDLRYVFLELAPQITDVDLTTQVQFETFVGVPGGEVGGAVGERVQNFFTLPRISAQTLATTVGVPDRGVVVVGGLSSSTRRERESGVPFLDKIPILKRLFSARGRALDRDTQFIMASPEIIILDEQEQRMR